MGRKMDLMAPEGCSFNFTRNWFRNRNLETFRKFIHPKWAGEPITYLELGVFEGMSICWMLQYILTHSKARAVGIDPWLMTRKLDHSVMVEVMDRAFHNTSCFLEWRNNENRDSLRKVVLQRGNSAEVLRRMVSKKGFLGIKPKSLDLCMIDGNHNALAVLDDCRLVFRLMRKGGWMLFDDVENDCKKTDHVKKGLGVFVSESRGKIKQVFKHRYMEAYEVL